MNAPCLALPAPLRRGDRVGLVAASSALDDGAKLAAGLELLRGWGLVTVDEARVRVTRRGLLLANQVAQRFV